METLRERDQHLECLWNQFSDVPMDPKTEKMCEPFLHFPQGTDREEIWKWFDERHSKGVVFLLGFGEVEYAPELQKLFQRRSLCEECESETCGLNPEGVCLYPLLHGKKPAFNEEDGCTGFLYKEDLHE